MLKYAVKGLLERNIPLQNTRCSWVALDWRRRKKCKLWSTVTTVFLFFVLVVVVVFVAVAAAVSPLVRESDSGIWKFLLVESGIPDSGIRNAAQRIQNPTNDLNPESKFSWQRFRNLVPAIRNRRRGDCIGFLYMERAVLRSKAKRRISCIGSVS